MAISDIKKEADGLRHEELVYLAAWFHHLARRNDPEYRKGLDSSWQAMDSGDRISFERYKRLSKDLDESGL